MRESGMLCEEGACVQPWRYGDPEWSRAGDEPLATPESLSEKAAYYEEISRRLHVHPELKWMMGAELPCKEIECGAGQSPPCLDCSKSDISIDEATWRDVVRWRSSENDGLWSALYMAAEAFRYAATRDDEALSMIRTLLEGDNTRMEITGVPGNFTRQYIPPGINGLSCPENKSSYIPDVEKDDNKWVRIGNDGCAEYVDAETLEWVTTDHCIDKKYAGWCWLDNTSKDEYSGNMFALGAVYKLVDDPQIREMVKGLLYRIGVHLVKNDMAFTDWDGRICEHGRIFAGTFGDYPGFNAAMALDFMKIIAVATGDARFQKYFDTCLMQKNKRRRCFKKSMSAPRPYTEFLPFNGMFPGFEGCKANYNNISMHMLSMHNLVWFEHDPALREKYQVSLDRDVFRAPGRPRAVIKQNNPWFDFIWASQKKLGPLSDGPAFDVVDNAVRMLRQFPARQHPMNIECPPDKCKNYCNDRFKRPVSDYPRQAAERCPGRFLWWSDPYRMGGCTENTRIIYPPADYLLPYWMGRYYGFIKEDQ